MAEAAYESKGETIFFLFKNKFIYETPVEKIRGGFKNNPQKLIFSVVLSLSFFIIFLSV